MIEDCSALYRECPGCRKRYPVGPPENEWCRVCDVPLGNQEIRYDSGGTTPTALPEAKIPLPGHGAACRVCGESYDPATECLCGACGATLSAPGDPAAETGCNAPAPLARPREVDGFVVEEAFETDSLEAEFWIVRRPGGTAHLLKIYQPKFGPKPEVLERLAALDVRHVAEVVSRGRIDDGRQYEIQPFATHGTLADLMATRRLAEAEIRDVLEQLSAAIAHLHEARIVHRDLKPANVLVRGLGPFDLALTDFGVSSASETTVARSEVIVGTTAYRAPEALSKVASYPGDWWSLGVMLFELLQGRLPWAKDADDRAIDLMLIFRDVTIPVDVPERWALLLRGLLTREYQHRWTFAEVDRWLRGETPAVRAPSGPAHCRPFLVRGRSCTTTKDIAQAAMSDWLTVRGDLTSGSLAAWCDTALGNQDVARSLRALSADRGLTDDLRLSTALLVLDPERPLTVRPINADMVTSKPVIVTGQWLQSAPLDALTIARSTFPDWVRELTGNAQLSHWAYEILDAERAIDRSEVPLELSLRDTLLVMDGTALMSQAQEECRRHGGSVHPRLHRIVTEGPADRADAVILLSCSRSLLRSPAEQQVEERLTWLRQLGLPLDYPRAEALVRADDHQVVARELVQLRASVAGSVHPVLQRLLSLSDPEVPDMVALVTAPRELYLPKGKALRRADGGPVRVRRATRIIGQVALVAALILVASALGVLGYYRPDPQPSGWLGVFGAGLALLAFVTLSLGGAALEAARRLSTLPLILGVAVCWYESGARGSMHAPDAWQPVAELAWLLGGPNVALRLGTPAETRLARRAIRSGDSNRAYDLLRVAIERHPADETSHLLMASILQSRGRYDLAIRVLDAYLGRKPGAPVATELREELRSKQPVGKGRKGPRRRAASR